MNYRKTLSLLALAVALMACSPKEKTCIVTGTVVGRPESTQLLFSDSFADPRLDAAVRMIPITDGAFSFEFQYTNEVAYQLIFEEEMNAGAMRPVVFFPVDGTITMELYPMEESMAKNIIVGGEDNKAYLQEAREFQAKAKAANQAIEDSLELLSAQDAAYDAVTQTLTPTAQRLVDKQKTITVKLYKEQADQLEEALTIPHYYSLISSFNQYAYFPDLFDLERLCAIQQKYATHYKDHPYTRHSQDILWGLHNLKTGGAYFDFTLGDLSATPHTLSQEIEGKYAVIDFWAPWCSPCISTSRKIKTLYDTYKDKGFTVVGVAIKYNDIADVERVVEKEQYPWVTLVDRPELDMRIVEHYGLSNSGGGCFLVDKNGKMVFGANPTIAQIEAFLKENL